MVYIVFQIHVSNGKINKFVEMAFDNQRAADEEAGILNQLLGEENIKFVVQKLHIYKNREEAYV